MLKQDFSPWLKEGSLLETDTGFILGQGPFVLNHFPLKGFYSNNFFLDNHSPWHQAKKLHFLNKKDFYKLLLAHKSSKQNKLKYQTRFSFIKFQTLFEQALQQIKQKKVEKLVPCLYETLTGEIQILELLKQACLNSKHQKRYLYGMWSPDKGFIGSTPELLFSYNNPSLKLHALAGTAPLYHSSLLQSQKELKEHRIVIKSITSNLANFSLKTGATQEVCFGNLKHLQTQIQGRCSRLCFNSVVKQLHPTAALGGFPKQASLEWLKLAPFIRKNSMFASPFGFFNGKDQGFCVVAIRGLEWNKKTIFLCAGVGLTEESNLQKEWQELLLKRNQINQLFQIV